MSTPAIFKPADILIRIVVFTVAYFWSNSGNNSDGTPTQLRIVTEVSDDTISLFIDTLITHNNVTIAIHNSAAAIIESDCPTGLCVQTGHIHTPGQISVCMPNGVWIEILGEEVTTDVISY